MALNIGTGELAGRLAKNYGMVGKLSLGIDENIVPVVLVDRLDVGPGPIDVRGGFKGLTQAALAANFSMVGVQVAPGMRLHVRGFQVSQACEIRIGRTFNAAAVFGTSPIAQLRGGDFSIPTSLASQAFVWTHTALDGFSVGFLGAFLGVQPCDFVLDGTLFPRLPANQQPWVGMVSTAVNTAITANFHVQEFPGLAK